MLKLKLVNIYPPNLKLTQVSHKEILLLLRCLTKCWKLQLEDLKNVVKLWHMLKMSLLWEDNKMLKEYLHQWLKK